MIAATSRVGQQHIGVDGPIAGCLLADRVATDASAESPVSFRLQNNVMRVAEAEFADSANPLSVLVTFDDDLIAHLTGRTRLTLQYPSAFWQSLGIGPGATPVNAPHPSNPLAHMDWWRV